MKIVHLDKHNMFRIFPHREDEPVSPVGYGFDPVVTVNLSPQPHTDVEFLFNGMTMQEIRELRNALDAAIKLAEEWA